MVSSADLARALRPLLELPVERVLVSHGPPVLSGGGAAIKERHRGGVRGRLRHRDRDRGRQDRGRGGDRPHAARGGRARGGVQARGQRAGRLRRWRAAARPRAAPGGRRIEPGRRRDRALPLRATGLAPPRGRARRARRSSPARLRDAARAAAADADVLVCEGVGGFLVPLTLGYLVRDLARDLALPGRDRGGAGARHDQPHPADRRGGPGRRASRWRLVVLTPVARGARRIERSNLEAIRRLGAVEVLETLAALDLGAPDSWPELRRARSRAGFSRRARV